MKLHVANYQPDKLGGGWSFANNLAKGMRVYPYEEADVYFIAGASMVQREDVDRAKADGKKIVLRLDNVLRNSRNRNTGMTRMKYFAEQADLLIFQSEWARDFLKPYLMKDGVVILNGVDLDLFHPPRTFRLDYDRTYLYSRFNRDEGKNWQAAWYFFYEQNIKDPESKLNITGQFSAELQEYNFDFFNGENFKFWGAVKPELMADIYRQGKYFIYTYDHDACSNSLIEALVSGCKIVGDKFYRDSGGAKEIMKAYKEFGRDYFSIERMVRVYISVMEKFA